MFRSRIQLLRKVWRTLAVLAAMAAAAGTAIEAVDSTGEEAEGSHVGLTSSLTTSGNEFVVSDAAASAAARNANPADMIGAGATSFEASYALANHTGRDLNLTMPRSNASPVVAAAKVPTIVFTVYDRDANVVWASWTNPGNLPNGPAVLKAGAVLKLTMQIPLRVGDQWLNGTYTLAATVNGAPEFGAMTRFEVSQGRLFKGRLPSPAETSGK